MVMMLHLVELKLICRVLDQADNRLMSMMSVSKNEMSSRVVLSENTPGVGIGVRLRVGNPDPV